MRLQVFQRFRHRSAFSWTSVISSYATAGQGHEALRAYDSMQKQGLEPTKYTFLSLLKACGSISDLHEGKRIHAEAVKYGYGNDLFVGTSLVHMYAKCRSVVYAQNVFDAMPQRNVVSWNAMLGAYAQLDKPEKVFELYEQMQQEGVSPDDRTFVSLLQACSVLAEKEGSTRRYGRSKWLGKGIALHDHARRKGYSADLFVANTLVSLYGKCGSIAEAQAVFDELSQRNVVTWTALLTGYVQLGQPEKAMQLYDQMQEEGVSPNERSIASAVQACGMLAEKEDVDGKSSKEWCFVKGKVIHDMARTKFYEADIFVGSSLVSMYGKCGSIVDARSVFDRLPHQNVVLWNALLAVYVHDGMAENALQLYEQMQVECVSPDVRTFVSILQACGMLAEKEDTVRVPPNRDKFLVKGKAMHADAQRRGYVSNVFVGTTLVSMYTKCGSLVDAQKVFDGMSERNVVSWNAILAGYVQQNQAVKAVEVYDQLCKEGISPDIRTFISALQACAMLAENERNVDGQATKLTLLRRGKAIHADIRSKSYESDVLLGNTLVSMYGSCGSIAEAQYVFDNLAHRNAMSWDTIVTAYAQQGQAEQAVQLYTEMQVQGLSGDDLTLVRVLQSCSNAGGLDLCRKIHRSLVSAGNSLSPPQASALVDAYGRCASMVDAQLVFDGLACPDVVSWTALVVGYARQGDSWASLRCFEDMVLAGVKPDTVTFLSLLSACSHSGLVDKGVEYFRSMSRDYGITPQMEHYSCMVDMLGRAGYFSKVEDLLLAMPMCPDVAMWLCVLGACQKHGKVVLGKQAFDAVVRVEPRHAGAYLSMWNIYADAGLWDLAEQVTVMRQKAGAWKKPGQSWVEHDQVVHTFMAGDRTQQLDALLNMVERR